MDNVSLKGISIEREREEQAGERRIPKRPVLSSRSASWWCLAAEEEGGGERCRLWLMFFDSEEGKREEKWKDQDHYILSATFNQQLSTPTM
jgi:hypothetical protein